MMLYFKTQTLLAAVLFVVPAAVHAGQKGATEADFHRGYYLHTHDGDPAAAAKAFEKVVAAPDAPKALRAEAKTRLAQCREDLAAEDFARLMPPDAMAYVEITDPGDHVARLAGLMGLIRSPDVAPADPNAKAIPLGDGLFLPEDFTLSPALVAEIKKIKGVAATLTAMDEKGDPVGVLVLHPGDSDLLRGALETAVQVLEPGEPIEGFKTYRIEKEAVLAVTSRLFIVARTRPDLVATVARLKNSNADSLASQASFKKTAANRENALLFAYVNGPAAYKQFAHQLRGREAVIAKTILDLEHFESATAVVRTTEVGIEIQARLDLMEGHQNLAYGLIRTAPFTKRSLQYVPRGTAAVALLGLNPAAALPTAKPPAPEGHYYLSAMDVGREIFANIEEIAVFVKPADAKDAPAGQPFPEIGVVIIAKDPAKSEALWNQLLALPALLGSPKPQSPRPVTIAGVKGTEYVLPDVPPIVLARIKDRAIVLGTRPAVASAIQATRTKKSIITDDAFKLLLARLTPDSSKAVLVHAGRAVAIAKPFAQGEDARNLELAGSLVDKLTFSVITNEKPTRFTLRAELTGLPDVARIIKAVAQAEQRKHMSEKNALAQRNEKPTLQEQP